MADLSTATQLSDDGVTYHASNHAGTIIPHVSLHLIFWGSAWPAPPTGPTANEVINAAREIVKGPYMTGLLQYGVKPGTLHGSSFEPSDPPNPLTKDAWHTKIWDLVDGGNVPPQGSGGLNLYMLVLPPGITFDDDPSEGGAHGAPLKYHFPFSINTVFAGFVLNQGTLDDVTANLSHEIVEACTDTEGSNTFANDGWTIDGRSHPHNEIADVCQNMKNYVNGVNVQGYWSNVDHVCIIPRAFSLKTFMLAKGLDPTKGLRLLNPPVTSVIAFISAG